mmetsp:Transcript_40633/g.85337  ORF Transcript_40633/g.85337 Transcript_40633/m.85337 type:complete len:436 (-) Transcript_40633:136-1443(-)|eukprot:CAMPEP_0183730752 /NCGR_PEP_ID=MMETSP0737-20130205/33613_1 /TAXON_ID=385413 /ORGANISM="Thalassiosira miniscula, Strain CCMP1093" /LENGTH=435 /DNA_ID=CAMNT_0025963331 /DNA_START=94 /DNA_END=1401 /DNA_ORIENTATION=-
MASPSNGAGGNNAGSAGNPNLCGAPFPPRPRAIATFLSSSDFTHGCQTLLYSVKRHLAPTPKDQYPPELLVLVSNRVSNFESKQNYFKPTFCDRIIRVTHIPIRIRKEKDSEAKKPSHVQSWDENCGWTKLRLFELDGYDTILYIDADCLVVKDVSHLLHIDDSPNGEIEKRKGLLAAAPDIFPPDKFNAGVMVLRPSIPVFDEMMSRLPGYGDSTKICNTYDGGDTGFLNSFYPGWYSQMPPYSRLPFGYNAQRFMHHCTYEKQPKYWDDAIDDIRVLHFSSSPKPWEKEDAEKPSSETKEETKDQQSYLDEKDTTSIQTISKRGKLERMWKEAYERSAEYYVARLSGKETPFPRSAPPPKKAPPPAKAASRAPPKPKPKSPNVSFQKRYKELRKTGMGTKEAMAAARAESGMDRQDDREMDPGQAVGRMFGLM